MWTNPGFSRGERKKKQTKKKENKRPWGKIGKMLTSNLIWIFPFIFVSTVMSHFWGLY